MCGQADRNTMGLIKPITENSWTIENMKLCGETLCGMGYTRKHAIRTRKSKFTVKRM